MAHMADERLFNIPAFVMRQFDYWVAHLPCRILVVSSDPDNLAGIASNRIACYLLPFAMPTKRLMVPISSKRISWTIIGAAAPRWAQMLFPAAATPVLPTAHFWEAIFKTLRIDQPDPVPAWMPHDQCLREMPAWLNNEQLAQLHTMAPGTDLVVGYSCNHIWVRAGAFNPRGAEFMANMPTEVLFTAPAFRRIDGTVASTKPLSYGGNILVHMHLLFMHGLLVVPHAKLRAAVY